MSTLLTMILLLICGACSPDMSGTGLFQKTKTCSADFNLVNQSTRPLLMTGSITRNLIDAHCKNPESDLQSKTVGPGEQASLRLELQCENCSGNYISRVLYVDDAESKSTQGLKWAGSAKHVSCTDIGCSPIP